MHTDDNHWVALTVDNYFSEFQADFMKHVIFEGQKLQVSWFLSFISTVEKQRGKLQGWKDKGR